MNTVKDSVFEELKREAIKIWETYNNTHGYVDEKVDRLNSFGNVGDNYGTIIGMFDINNQEKLYNAVGVEAQTAIDGWVGGLVDRVREARDMGLY